MDETEQNQLELTGAASALKYLETREKRLREQLDRAEEKVSNLCDWRESPPPHLDGEDFNELIAKARGERKDTEDSYYKAQKALLDYDKSVSTARRDVSEKLSRAEAEKILITFSIVMRGGVEQLSSRQAQDSMECKSSEEMYQITNPLLRECFGNALDSAVASEQLPDWVRSAVLNAL